MGTLGQQLAGDRRKELIEDLMRAYADEWFAHYNYFFVSKTISGPAWPALGQLLRRKAEHALTRVDRLVERIIALGGQPVSKLTDLPEYATDKPFKLPENVRDIDGALKAVLDAERTSLRTYRALGEKSRERDPVTHALALEFFTEAVQGEEEIERLLGGPAPEMDGQ
jgi:bacterioferritin